MIARLLLEDLKVDRVEVASARVSDGEFEAVKMICDWAARRNLLHKVEVLGFVDGHTSVDWIQRTGCRVINLLCKGSLKHCTQQLKKTPASSIVRTRTLRQTDGMLKAIINNHNGKIMGCTLFCADASEIINIVAMAIKTGQTSTFLRDFIFTHPSMSEGLNQLFDV